MNDLMIKMYANMYTNTHVAAAVIPIKQLWRKTPWGKKAQKIELIIMGALALWALYGVAMFIKYPKKGIIGAILPIVVALIYYVMNFS